MDAAGEIADDGQGEMGPSMSKEMVDARRFETGRAIFRLAGLLMLRAAVVEPDPTTTIALGGALQKVTEIIPRCAFANVLSDPLPLYRFSFFTVSKPYNNLWQFPCPDPIPRNRYFGCQPAQQSGGCDEFDTRHAFMHLCMLVASLLILPAVN